VSRVTVYQFTIYDGWNDEFRLSSRWATHEAIESTRIGVIQEHTGTLIDQAHLDENGMTARGFDPAISNGDDVGGVPISLSDQSADPLGSGGRCDYLRAVAAELNARGCYRRPIARDDREERLGAGVTVNGTGGGGES
jgi:hypothetical protein